ncbi:MAG: hypothetical protein KDD61_14260 [Bdellovibrionales bacterium]|nr:hypothetical protein [Bdellovibrionales bacterium]
MNSSLKVKVNELFTLQVSGGEPPYNFERLSGNSVVNNYGQLTADSAPELVNVRIRDNTGFYLDKNIVVYDVGQLDPTFGTLGIQFFKPNEAVEEQGKAIKIDAMQRIVVVAQVNNGGTGIDFVLARYLSDGSLDSDFGVAGIASFDGGVTGPDIPRGALIDSNQKILVFGQCQRATTSGDFCFVRFDSDGHLDTTFNGTGSQVFNVEAGSVVEGVADVVEDGSGNYVWTGQVETGDINTVVGRITDVGALDGTFNTTGYRVFDGSLSNTEDRGLSVKLDSNGKVVVGGYAFDTGGNLMEYMILRLDNLGAFDNTFSGDGHFVFDIGNTNHDISQSLNIKDGLIYIAGRTNNGANTDVAIARVTDSGVLDGTFGGGDGIFTWDGSGNDDLTGATSVQFDSSGRIVLLIDTVSGGYRRPASLRLSAAGDLDLTYGNSGIAISSIISGQSHTSRAAVFEDDGSVLVCGSVDTVSNSKDVFISKIWYE